MKDAKNRIAIEKGRVFNVTEKREVKVLNVFDENEHNLIMAVIGESPEEIVIEDTPLSKEMYDTLKHIAVVYKN